MLLTLQLSRSRPSLKQGHPASWELRQNQDTVPSRETKAEKSDSQVLDLILVPQDVRYYSAIQLHNVFDSELQDFVPATATAK